MTFEPRHVPAGTEVTYTDAEGAQRTLRSRTLEGDESYAFIEPRDQADATVLDGFGYPVARKVLDARQAADHSRPTADDQAAQPRGRK